MTHLDPIIKRDLAILCESHTKDDIDNIEKYKLSQPYGNNAEEWVNLQYLAAILRTVDLLQISRSPAPSILYRVINPTDPISQIEWQKQNAVRSVRASTGFDREGHASEDAERDTIEVHARFNESDGFFGLTSYLTYAEREISKTSAIILKSSTRVSKDYLFPWKYINQKFVEAEGFLTKSFGFQLDQQKILDLLTGHTLYNDTSVVLRELTQNSLDAVRLQASIAKVPAENNGMVHIHWDSQQKILTIRDNGTGMTQQTIEDHLLKVGSSRYQDEKFKEDYPDFSSISRFGIGVLSAFMVADSVEITTCSPEDEPARRISLRSVHGKYLIKLLDKVADRDDIGVWPHGTLVRLALRSTASLGDVLRVAQRWLLFPGCNVTVKIDDQPPVKIGYESPKAALEAYIDSSFTPRRGIKADLEVREVSLGGVTLAYAVQKDDHFKDWGFVQIDESRHNGRDGEAFLPVATCVEGVGVEFSSPGFRSASLLAVANVVGKGAPRTNVARSAIEDTDEFKSMNATIYSLYAEHVSSEISRLEKIQSNSLTRAVSQAPFIAWPLTGERIPVRHPALMQEAASKIPMVLIEGSGQRKNVSINDIRNRNEFWTVESPLTRSVEYFINEAPANISADTLLKSLGNTFSPYPSGETVSNYMSSTYISSLLKDEFELSEAIAYENHRRIDLRWERREGAPKWLNSADLLKELAMRDRRLWEMVVNRRNEGRNPRGTGWGSVKIAPQDFVVSGLDGYGGFVIGASRFFMAEQPVSIFLTSLRGNVSDEGIRTLNSAFRFLETVCSYTDEWEALSPEFVNRLIEISGGDEMIAGISFKMHDFLSSIRGSNSKFFDPFAWQRREG